MSRTEKGNYYITTAITYTSGKPHIGNTYEIVLADSIARFKRQQGYQVFFQTGTDEHGQKIEDKAKETKVTPREYVEAQLEMGKDVILEIEIQGALKIKEKFPSALLLFVMPPSANQLRERLAGRGTETQEVIDKRLCRAAEEAEGIESYDYIVINDDLEVCTKELHSIIFAAHNAVDRNEGFIENMRQELNVLVKGEK